MPNALPELRDAEADRPQADDAERLPGQLEAAEAAVLEAARSRRFVRVEETAPECEQRPERELGDGLRRRGGDDCDGHALRRRGLDVDVRVAGRARGDESQVGKALEHGGVDLRVRVERDEHAGRRRRARRSPRCPARPKLTLVGSSPLSRARSGSSSGSQSTTAAAVVRVGDAASVGGEYRRSPRSPWPAEGGAPLGAPPLAGLDDVDVYFATVIVSTSTVVPVTMSDVMLAISATAPSRLRAIASYPIVTLPPGCGGAVVIV